MPRSQLCAKRNDVFSAAHQNCAGLFNARYNRPMTDAEKLADYERVIEIIKDEMSLEEFYVKEKKSWGTIEFIRADAYKNIVDVMIGIHKLAGG